MSRRALLLQKVGVIADTRFIMTVKSNNTGTSGSDQFTIPTNGGGYLYDVETSDGYTASGLTGDHTITFPSGAGTYDVYITGTFPKIYFSDGGDKLKALDIKNFGIYGQGTTDQSESFYGASNMTMTAIDGLFFNGIVDGGNMFRNTAITGLPDNVTLESLDIANAMFRDSVSFTELPIGVTLPLLTRGNVMFRGVTLATERYSQLLIDLESGNLNDNVTFHGGNSRYNSSAVTARANLVARGWTITDNGLE